MAWPKGKPRAPGVGRKAGTPNRKTQSLMEQCEAKGVNVFDLMLEYVTEPCEPGLRLQAIKELMKYIHPQRKAVEHSGEMDQKIEVIITDYTKKIE